MALQSSGAISLNDIHIEAGGSSGSLCAINDADIRGLISKGSGANMSFSEWYGASGVTIEGPYYSLTDPRLFSRIYIEFTGKVLDYFGWFTVVGSIGYRYPSDSALYFNQALTTFNYGAGVTVNSGWYHFVRQPCDSYIQSSGGLEEGVYQVTFSIWRSTSTTYPF